MSEVKQYLTNRGELLCADSLQPAEVYRLVDAKDYDALAAKLAMAEDAAAREMLPASSAAAWRWRSRNFAPN